MNLQMVGIDFQSADVARREPLALVRGQVLAVLPVIAAAEGVHACAVLSTCNRTELYLHAEPEVDALLLLTGAVGVPAEPYRSLGTVRSGEAMVRHVMEVASGLKSQIFGDDQIITQMRTALDLAREAGTADGVLDTLLRRATQAGKRVKTEVRLNGVASSAAACAVQKAVQYYGNLAGKRAVVIGNGEMGRLAATLLRDAGCHVTITLRSYRHGHTIVPAGCGTHPYEERYAVLEGADLVCSATTSPHLTLTAPCLARLHRPPHLLVDLAMPRDIDQAAANDPRMIVWNLDDLSLPDTEHEQQRARAGCILEEAYADFRTWYDYRAALPVIAKLKDLAAERVRFDHDYADLAQENDVDGLVQLAVSKTVDMLLGGMKDIVSLRRLSGCLTHMQKGSGK